MSNYPLAMSSWDEKEIKAINDVIDSDMYSMGAKVQEFERNFADYLNVPYCVMVNSGSSANLLGVAALFYKKENPLKAGDEVIVPAVSWSTTYYPLSQYGLKIKFVDIDRETLNIDLNQLKEAITDKTRMILTVNLLGNSNEFIEIKNMISGKNIYLFEDNCESLGATYNGIQAGTHGEVGTFSTFFSHHIATMEGGVVAVHDEELYHILLSIRSHGWTRHLPKENKVTGTKSDFDFEESFKFVLPGYNLRPVEMSGAIGIEQLRKLPSFIEERRSNAIYFIEKMKSIPEFQIQKEIGESSWFGFSLVIKDPKKINRNDLVKFLSDRKIDCRPIVTGNFVRNPVIKYMEHEIFGSLENADYIHDHGFFVGNHHVDCKKNIDFLTTQLREFLDK